MVAPALRTAAGSELLAIARADAARLAAFAATHRVERTYTRWQDLVQDRDVNAVYIATPPDVHCQQTVAAAEAGKHVLCEKPMALSVDECQRMIDACRTRGVTLGIAYYRGFFPVVRRVQEILSSCEIGRPVIAHVLLFSPFDPAVGAPRQRGNLRNLGNDLNPRARHGHHDRPRCCGRADRAPSIQSQPSSTAR